jgi:hypothetical protein
LHCICRLMTQSGQNKRDINAAVRKNATLR